MKKILITGSRGFIGKNLSEKHCEEYDLFTPSRQQLNLLDQKEVKDYLSANKFDVVIHCATQPSHRNAKEPIDFVLEKNLSMFFNLERCNDFYGKMLFIGSGAEYDM